MNDEPERILATVLLIDDSPTEFVLAKALLKLDKVQVNFTAIHDGEEAVRYLQDRKGSTEGAAPDLVFLDINLPAMDGREVLAAIKQDPSLNNIPVVMYSGSNAKKDIEETRDLGAVSYMEKPLNFEKLRTIVDQLPQLQIEERGDERYLYCVA